MSNQRTASRAGFSMVEMLVVIGIILVLGSITLTVVIRAQRSAEIARLKADLAAVASALDAYAHDFKGQYPMTRDPVTGAATGEHLLAKALIGPGPATEDGVDGPGFRAIPTGKPWKPYLSPEKFKTQFFGNSWELLDVYGTPIGYLPQRNRSAAQLISVPGSMSPPAPPSMFNSLDVIELSDRNGPVGGPRQQWFLRGIGHALGDDSGNNAIDGPETLRAGAPYVLFSAGPDRKFADDPTRYSKSDDVYNFDR